MTFEPEPLKILEIDPDPILDTLESVMDSLDTQLASEVEKVYGGFWNGIDPMGSAQHEMYLEDPHNPQKRRSYAMTLMYQGMKDRLYLKDFEDAIAAIKLEERINE